MNERLDKVRNLKLETADGGAPAPSSHRWIAWFAVLVVVVGGAVLVFWSGALPGDVAANPDDDSNETIPAASNAAASAELPPSGRFTAAGYIEPMPPFPIHIAPLVLGRIDEFSLVEGHSVKAGDLIARLNADEMNKQLAELRAALGVNAEQLAFAESELTRSKKLTATGVTTTREWERARADAAILKAEAAKIRAGIETLDWQIQQTEVRAPADGVLFERLAHVGDTIYADSKREIASLYDPQKLQVWVDVNQRDASRLRIGQPVEIALDAEPGRIFSGRVSRILPRASLPKNTIQAKISLDAVSPNFRPDMSVKVTFLNPEDSSTTHPATAP